MYIERCPDLVIARKLVFEAIQWASPPPQALLVMLDCRVASLLAVTEYEAQPYKPTQNALCR